LLRIKAQKRLRDYTLDVDLGSDDGTLILMGNNGSGKTTVLNLAAGLMKPDSGVVEVSGEKLFDSDTGVDVPIEDRNVGYVFQNYALFPHMSVYGNVAFGLRMRHAADIEGRVRAKSVLPEPGGPHIRILWAPAAATSSALLTCSWPFISDRSVVT
jgi:molybdate transport system ATP-binding protein